MGARKVTGIALLAVLALVAAACGSGGHHAGATTTTSAAPAPATSADGATTPTTAGATTTGPASSAPVAVLSATLGAPVSRAVAIADGASVIVFGGLTASQRSADGIFRVDPVTGSATRLGVLVTPTHDAAGARVGDRWLVFGGGDQQTSSLVQSFPANGSRGKAVVAGHLPAARSDLAAVTAGGTVYLVGGYDGHTLSPDVWATTDGSSFRTVARLAVPVRYPAIVTVGDRLLVLGGETASGQSAAVQEIDPAAGTAQVVAQLPEPRGHASALVVGDRVWVLGGRVGGAPSATTVWYDPATHSTSAGPSLPGPVADAALATAGGASYLFGGEAPASLASIIALTSGPASAGVTAAAVATPSGGAAWKPGDPPFVGQFLIADRGNNRLIVIDNKSNITWTYPSPTAPAPPGGFYFPDDGFFTGGGTGIITNEEDNHTIVRLAYPSGAITWSYGHPRHPGSAPGYLYQPDDAFLLKDGRVMVADATNCRILFITPSGQPEHQIGTIGRCAHRPPSEINYPNGDTPIANGDVLVSEVHGSWIDELRPDGTVVWSVHLPEVTYPSDPQQLGPDRYLVADFATPGGVYIFDHTGRILWSYRVGSGPGMLDHPSLAEQLPNGLIGVNDDWRNRVVLIDPNTSQIVWQYGVTDQGGTGPGQLHIPDGFDLLLPDGTTPTHPSTG